MHSIIHVDKAKNLNILISTKDKSGLRAQNLDLNLKPNNYNGEEKVQEIYSPSMHVGLATVIKDTSTSKQ